MTINYYFFCSDSLIFLLQNCKLCVFIEKQKFYKLINNFGLTGWLFL